MGWLGNLFSGGDTVRGALEGAGTFARDMRAAITGDIDPERAAELAARAMEIEAAAARAQTEINTAEAAHPSLFVAGWRPGLGWVGVLSIAYQFLLRPLLSGLGVAEMPEIETAALWPIITAMLGLGGMRTVEKNAGTQSRH